MGQHGCRTIYDNGEWLIDFCGLNSLVIGGTLFAHKEIHKLTRTKLTTFSSVASGDDPYKTYV